MKTVYRVCSIVCIGLVMVLLSPAGSPAEEIGDEWSLSIYWGRFSNNDIAEILSGERKLESSYLLATAFSRPLCHFVNTNLVLEAEVNTAVHSGMQNHFELGIGANLRWKRFPWDRYLSSTLAYGLGLSFASERPSIEDGDHHAPDHLLLSMPIELTFSPPARTDRSWEFLVRIHHRSGAHGYVSHSRGSNFICAGLRYRF